MNKTVYYFNSEGKFTGLGISSSVPDGATESQPNTPDDVFDGETWVTPAIEASPPALGNILTDRWSIPADNTTVATVTYTADDTVYFVVNDTVHTIEPVDYVAALEITADAPGPIRIEVRDKQITIVATEV